MSTVRPRLAVVIGVLFLVACGDGAAVHDAGSMDSGIDAASTPDGGEQPDGGPPDGGAPPGTACESSADCASGACADGVCCDRACDAPCEACTALLRGTGSDGDCGPVAAGSDPDADCDATPASSCGLDGECDGAGACRSWDATTVCAAAECTSGIATSDRTCTGAGSCADAAPEACAPYACGATACLDSCVGDVDCAAGARCTAGVCTPLTALGGDCSLGASCGSGICVDGVCCDTACTGLCQGCNVAGSLGTCQLRPGGWSDQTCLAPLQCSNEGTCLRSYGMTCSAGSECLGGNCVDGYCCNDACEGTCIACNNVSERGRCSFVHPGLDPLNECAGAATCNGTGACSP